MAVAALFFLVFSVSGCIWIMAGYAGVAVTTATVDEYREAQTNSTGTEELDDYLEEQRRIAEAFENCPEEGMSQKTESDDPFAVKDLPLKLD